MESARGREGSDPSQPRAIEVPTFPRETPAGHASRAGSRVGAYEVIAPIGRGGMGEVYRARDLETASRRRDQGPAGRFLAGPRSGSCVSSARRGCSPRSITRTSPRSTASRSRTARRFLVMELVEGPTLAETARLRTVAGRRSAVGRPPDRVGPRGGARSGHHPSGPEALQRQGPARTARSRCSTSGSRESRRRPSAPWTPRSRRPSRLPPRTPASSSEPRLT